MNIQQLKVFVYTVKYEKLYLVAKKLNIKQPTVTFHLNKLQDSLGVDLLKTRSFHSIKLTKAGEEFYKTAQIIINQYDELDLLMSDYKNLNKGSLSICSNHTPATYMILPYINDITKTHDNLSISVHVDGTSSIVNKVKNFECDIGIINSNDFNDDDLIAHHFSDDPLIVVFTPDHPLNELDQITAYDLERHSFINHEEGSTTRSSIDNWTRENNIDLNVKMVSSGSESVKEAVKLGMGFAILSSTLVSAEIKNGILSFHQIPKWTLNRKVYLIYRKGRIITPTMKLFIESLKHQV